MCTYGNWSNLLPEIVRLIFEKLTDNLDDLSTCARVCGLWLCVADQLFKQLSAITPFILLTHRGYERTPTCKGYHYDFYATDVPSQEQYCLFNTQTRKIHELRLPKLHGRCFRSASNGWLLTTGCEYANEINLLNPLTRIHIGLPPLWHWQYAWTEEFFRVLTSSSPSNPNSIILGIYKVWSRNIGLCRPRDQTWNMIEGEWEEIDDAIFYKGDFYILGLGKRDWNHAYGYTHYLYRIHVDETDLTASIEKLLRLPKPRHGTLYKNSCLVELMGNLLLVTRYSRQFITTIGTGIEKKFYHTYMPIHMRVHKLKEDGGGKRRWVKCTNLGEYAIYLGCCNSVSVFVGESDGRGRECRPNCIYYIDDNWVERFSRGQNGVFNLGSKRFKRLYTNQPVQTIPLNWFRF